MKTTGQFGYGNPAETTGSGAPVQHLFTARFL